ncbi:MAG: hypothetical protein KGL39_47295 [Patescibacteria group bacterium]|nr:hypothetical protein [Patescibacteria group bacterium]
MVIDLSTIKVGDVVGVTDRYQTVFRKVKKLTKTQIVCIASSGLGYTYRYRRGDGVEIGSLDRWSRPSIERLATDDEAWAFERDLKQGIAYYELQKRRDDLLSRLAALVSGLQLEYTDYNLETFTLKGLTADQVRKVAEVLSTEVVAG